MYKGLSLSTFFVYFLLLFFPTLSSAAAEEPITFDAGKGVLTAHVSNCLISEVLQQVAKKTGITAMVMPAADRNINIQLTKVPLEVALRQVLRDTNYAFTYQKRESGYVVTGVRVLASGDEGVPTRQPATPPPMELAAEQSPMNKTDGRELVRQKQIEAAKLQKMRRERKLPPVGPVIYKGE